jgi:hypothetical protein
VSESDRSAASAPPSASLSRALVDGEPLGGWVTGALLVGLVSLGLPWGEGGSPGYMTIVRVPVIAAGVAVLLGWRMRSRSLVRAGMVFAVVALLLAHLVGGGAIALALGLVILELGIRRTHETSSA